MAASDCYTCFACHRAYYLLDESDKKEQCVADNGISQLAVGVLTMLGAIR